MISRRSRQSVVSPETAARAVEEAGRRLRATREARGEALEAAAATLCIRPAYLMALEAGNLEILPGRPYAVGFLRSYATHLGLDAEAVLGEVRPALDRLAAPPPPAYRQPVPEGRRIGAKVATASMLLLGALYGGYLVIHRGQEMAPDRVSDVTGEAERLAGVRGSIGAAPTDALPLPTPAELASLESRAPAATTPPRAAAGVPVLPGQAPAPAPRLGGMAVAVGAANDPSVAQAASSRPTAAPPPDAASAVAAEAAPALSTTGTILGVPAAPAIAGGPLAAAAADPAGDPGNHVVLVATESSWVQVRSPDREFFKMGTLEPGERLVLPDRTDLALWTGNAGGLQIEVGGRTLGTPGRRGQVVRDLPLTPDQLEARLIR